MYIMCFTVNEDEVRLTASKEEQQQLLQQYKRMGHAKDVQILQLQNENEVVQEKCKLTLNSHTPIPQLLSHHYYNTSTVNCTYQQLSDLGLWILLTLVFKQTISL